MIINCAKYDNKLFKRAAGLCVTEQIIRKRTLLKGSECKIKSIGKYSTAKKSKF